MNYWKNTIAVLKKYSMEMLNKFIYVEINNPLKTWWKAKKYFKSPKILADITIHNPFCNVCHHRIRNGILFLLDVQDVSWKYKYDNINFEYEPYIRLIIFNIIDINVRFIQIYNNQNYTLEYWECVLMYVYKNASLLEALRYSIWHDDKGNKVTPITNICLRKQW